MVNLVPVNHHVQGWVVCLMFWRSYFVVCAVLVLCVELYQCDHVKGIGAARAHTHVYCSPLLFFLLSNPVSQTLLAGSCEGCCRL